MFRKVGNIDLINRLEKIENKLDILNVNLNSRHYCNCRNNEVCIYKELCDYLEIKFRDCILNSSKPNDAVLQQITDLNQSFNTIDVKLNSIYFENEIIKHQLLLQDDIRQYILEIDTITLTINSIIKKIDDFKSKL